MAFFVNGDLLLLVGNTPVEVDSHLFHHLLALSLPPVNLGFVVMASPHHLSLEHLLLGIQPNFSLLLESLVEFDDFFLGSWAVVISNWSLFAVNSLQPGSGVNNPSFDLSLPFRFLHGEFLEVGLTKSGYLNEEG